MIKTKRIKKAPPTFSVDPMHLKLAFSTQERIDIRADADADPITRDFLYILDSSERITNRQMLSDGLDYIASKNIITTERKNEIMGAL